VVALDIASGFEHLVSLYTACLVNYLVARLVDYLVDRFVACPAMVAVAGAATAAGTASAALAYGVVG
jgi:hypothetical protein